MDVAAAFLSTDVKVLCGGGEPRPASLRDIGPFIAGAYARATTRWKVADSNGSGFWVRPARPLLVLATSTPFGDTALDEWDEVALVERDQSPEEALVASLSDVRPIRTFYLYDDEGFVGADVWAILLGNNPPQEGRELALHLSRFHSERVTMMEVARSLSDNELGTPDELRDGGRWDSLQRLMHDGFGYLNRDVGPLANASLLGSLEADLRINATDWDVLKSTVNEMRFHVGQRAITYIERYIMGDSFENISDTVIINRSHVRSSLNTLTSRGEEDIAAALKEIAKFLDQSGAGPDAAESFQNLVQEAASPKRSKSRLRAFWDQLVSHAPAVTSLGSAVTAITSLL